MGAPRTDRHSHSERDLALDAGLFDRVLLGVLRSGRPCAITSAGISTPTEGEPIAYLIPVAAYERILAAGPRTA